MLSFFYKIKNLRFKEIGAKSAAFFLINRKLNSDELGKVTDLQLDRTAKSMILTAVRESAVNTITIKGYKIVLFKGKSFLAWERLTFEGADQQRYRKIFKDVERIEVPKQITTLLEVIL